MKNEKSAFTEFLLFGAVAGNIFFMLWMTYNGIHERFQGTVFEKISYFLLMLLLSINSYFVIRKNK